MAGDVFTPLVAALDVTSGFDVVQSLNLFKMKLIALETDSLLDLGVVASLEEEMVLTSDIRLLTASCRFLRFTSLAVGKAL